MKTFSNALLVLASSLAITGARSANVPTDFKQLADTRNCKAENPVTITFDKQNFESSKLLPLLDDETAKKAGVEFAGFYGLDDNEKGGIVPSTKPNQIVGGSVNGLLQGNHSMFVAPGNAAGTKYFDLDSLSFGCTLITNDVTGALPGVATDCKMTMIGYYMGKQIGKQTYDYQPNGQVQAQSENITMSNVQCHQDFKGVDLIQFETDNKLLKTMNLDTIKITPHTCKNKK